MSYLSSSLVSAAQHTASTHVENPIHHERLQIVPANDAARSLFTLLRGSSTRIGLNELRNALGAALPRNVLDEAMLSRLAEKLLSLADIDGDGDVTADELSVLLERFPALLGLLGGDAGDAEGSVKTATASPSVAPSSSSSSSRLSGLTRVWAWLGFGAPTAKTVAWVSAVIAATVGAGVQAAIRFSPRGKAEAAARVGGAALYLCVFLLHATMLRRTWGCAARSRTLARLLPLDSLVAAHVAAGVGALAALPLHVGGHAVHWIELGVGVTYVFGRENPEGTPGVRGAAATGVLLTLLFAAAAAGYAARVRCG
jgi:hypothetical protein